jgi:hypothetical protein
MKVAHHLGLASAVAASALACGNADSQVTPDEPVGSDELELTANALTHAESRAALQLIDNICGDTWCEGDYDFAFRRLTCSQETGSCHLLFQIFPREGVPAERAMYWRSCRTAGFTGFDSLVDTAPGGATSLRDDYYGALTTCIGGIEERLR